MTKRPRSMKLAEMINIHNYLMRLQPPLSEPAKEILREIEEHILSVIQKERNPIQTHSEHKPNPNYPIQPPPQTEPNPAFYHPETHQFKEII